MKNGILLVLFLVATGSVGAQTPPGDGDASGGIPFEVNRDFGTILVRVKVNGHPGLLVLDTGSSNTILSSELLQVRPLAFGHAQSLAKGSGYVGTAAWTKATLEVGTLRWSNRRVLVMNDFHEISNSMKQKVDGILGEDVLREFGSLLVDFRHHRLFVR